MTLRNTEPEHDPRERFGLYRLCDCPTCGGSGKAHGWEGQPKGWRCPDCRGEGRVRQEVASCESPEAVGVALVTLAQEGEWEECPLGLLDRMPECETCGGRGKTERISNASSIPPYDYHRVAVMVPCPDCKGSGVKPTGTWLILPWLPSPRNASDAGKLLRSRRS